MEPLAAGMRALLGSRERELQAGAEPLGWKIGINSEVAQERLGLSAPVVGYMTSANAIGDGEPVAIGRWTNPMLEPEVGIRVGPGEAADALAPAIELVDLDLPLDDLEQILIRNVFHRGVVLGAASEVDPPGLVTCTVARAGEQVASVREPFDAAAVIRHVRDFLAAHDAELRAGEWIIAGSLTPPIALSGEERVEVAIEGLGGVSVIVEP